MKTLYDLLGALPDDDAESLRTAFHKAVRASHPDINTDDPDAPSRFRKIVRANAILSDAQQRATYDRLVALALRQASAKSKRGIRSGSIRKLASDAMAVAFLSAVSIGGYIVFERLSMASAVPAKMVEVAARGPAEVAAVAPTAQPDTGLRDELRETFERAGVANEAMAPDAVTPAANPAGGQAVANVGAAPDLPANHANSYARYEPGDTPESAGVADEAIAPSAVAAAPSTNSAQAVANAAPVPDAPSAAAPAADTGSAQANAVRAPDLTVNDAKSYRERGIFAYRDGDLYRAIADFDLAIQHDPSFAEAYIDRGIVFYRMHEFDRAFADIAQAKRIESANRTKTAPPALRKDERSYRSGRLREVRS
jgi:tetratricopeptide (TPR) repeat protein